MKNKIENAKENKNIIIFFSEATVKFDLINGILQKNRPIILCQTKNNIEFTISSNNILLLNKLINDKSKLWKIEIKIRDMNFVKYFTLYNSRVANKYKIEFPNNILSNPRKIDYTTQYYYEEINVKHIKY